jgi:hypothetical protein
VSCIDDREPAEHGAIAIGDSGSPSMSVIL